PTGNSEIFVTRYTASGTLDPSFASGGKFTLQLAIRLPSGLSGVLGCAARPDGGIVAAGYRDGMNNGVTFAVDAVVLALDAHGMLDAGFANGGILIQQFSVGTMQRCDASGLLLLPDERILLAIEGNDASDQSSVGVARLTAGGALDPNFGTNGYTLAP